MTQCDFTQASEPEHDLYWFDDHEVLADDIKTNILFIAS